MMWNIETRILEFIRRQGLIEDGDGVLVALSGGADSVCLLRVLLALREKCSIQIHAAHYNHRLRGADSAEDEQFVRDLCKRLDVPLTVSFGDVAGEAKRTHRSVEETAREMRYAFLDETAETVGADKIATGHHADDNAETVLLHLTRGAGLRGLAGIPPKRGCIVRPLLSITRQEILGYLADLKQDFVEDRTNEDTAIRRNAIRHLVMPVLQEQNPNLLQTITRQSEILRRDARFLDALAAKTFESLRLPSKDVSLSAEALTALNVALSSRVVALAIQAAGGETAEVHVGQVLALAQSADPSAQTDVPGCTVRREYDRLVFSSGVGKPTDLCRDDRPRSSAPPHTTAKTGGRSRAIAPTNETAMPRSFTPRILPPEGTILIPEAGIRITILPEWSEKEGKVPTFLFQSAAICGKLSVGPRQVGDFIRLNAAGGTKMIKKLMIERKIPAHMRDSLPVFSDERGVIAVCGIGIDMRVAPRAGEETLGILVEELEEDA